MCVLACVCVVVAVAFLEISKVSAIFSPFGLLSFLKDAERWLLFFTFLTYSFDYTLVSFCCISIICI